MRVFALVLILVLGISAGPAPVRAAAPSRESALLSLCRLWNAVRFFHPTLASETDAGWDDALVAAEPLVDRDPGALRDAAGAMLATLHDPLTTLDVDRHDAPAASPTSEERNGVRTVRLNGYPARDGAQSYEAALVRAVRPAAGDRAMVVDLRTGPAGSFEQLDALETAWSRADLTASVIDAPTAMPVFAQRYYVGFPPESGSTSGDYREGRETTAPTRVVAPAKGARKIPLAFVVDANAEVPADALALARAGDAVFFSADGSAGIQPGDVQLVDAGNGLRAALRMTATDERAALRNGGLEAALQWARDPNAAAAPLTTAWTPAAPVPISERFAGSTLPDAPHRALALFRMWGTIAYFFPYKAQMRDDWDAAFEAAAAETRNAGTSLDYELALLKMYAHIHDTHGFVVAPAVAAAYGYLPAFVARDVEGKPTIVRADAAIAKRDGFAVGDVVEAVDGERVAARLARLRPYVAASTEQSARDLLENGAALPALLAGPRGSVATLVVRGGDGRPRTVRTPRTSAYQSKLRERTRPVVDILAGNVGYIDLQRLTVPEVDGALQRLARTRAIVFDLRGYPRQTGFVIAPHFVARPVRAALFQTPVRRTPLTISSDEEGATFIDETRDFFQTIAPKGPRYTQPAVVVIDARAISQSEHTGLFLAASAHARFVGEPTTGANGDVTRFSLPGGLAASFTGQAVRHPDGSPLQRVGLVPDVHVSQTLRGVRAGDDELLEAGLREALRLGHATAATTRDALAAERSREHTDAVAQMQPPAPPPPVAADAPPLPDAFATRSTGYEGGHDPSLHHRDGRTIVLRAKTDAAPSAFGTLIETIPLEQYRGKRVRVSGVLRSENAKAGMFWLRVDGPGGTAQAFDNMYDRALSGTRDWTPFTIVLDVPADAQQLIGGLLLQPPGALWADDLRIDVVDQRVPTTSML
jgi:C-terminal processing protease CtpA/Prc